MAGEVSTSDYVRHGESDSYLFRTREELEEGEGAWPIGGNRFDSSERGMVAAVRGQDGAGDLTTERLISTINEENLFRPGQQESIPDLGEDETPSRSSKVALLCERRFRATWKWVERVGHRLQGHYRRHQHAHHDLSASSHAPARDIRCPYS